MPKNRGNNLTSTSWWLWVILHNDIQHVPLHCVSLAAFSFCAILLLQRVTAAVCRITHIKGMKALFWMRPAGGALGRFLSPAGVRKTRQSGTSAFFSDLRPCLHPSWRSPRILSTPLRQIHSFSTPTWHAAFAGRKGKETRASLRCGFLHVSVLWVERVWFRDNFVARRRGRNRQQ